MTVRTFLINLDKDHSRLEQMTDQLNALELPFERFPAVSGLDMPEWLKEYFLSQNGAIASSLLPGEIGCYASHLVLHDLIARADAPALVLEDDLEIAPDFSDILSAVDRLPEGWEIVRLSNPYKRQFVPVSQISDRYRLVKFCRVSPSTGAYLISPNGARKFLNWKKLRSLPIDQDLRRTWDCKLITYGVHPRPIIPDVGSSSIDGMKMRSKEKLKKSFGLLDWKSRIVHDIRWLGLGPWLSSLIYISPADGSKKTNADRFDDFRRRN